MVAVVGRSHVPKSQAALLPNKTIAANSDGSGGYLVGIAVIHQLHCLVSLDGNLFLPTSISPLRRI